MSATDANEKKSGDERPLIEVLGERLRVGQKQNFLNALFRKQLPDERAAIERAWDLQCGEWQDDEIRNLMDTFPSSYPQLPEDILKILSQPPFDIPMPSTSQQASQQGGSDQQEELESLRQEIRILRSHADGLSARSFERHIRANLIEEDCLHRIKLRIRVAGVPCEDAVMEKRMSKLLAKCLEMVTCSVKAQTEEEKMQGERISTYKQWTLSVDGVAVRCLAVRSLLTDVPTFLRRHMSGYVVALSSKDIVQEKIEPEKSDGIVLPVALWDIIIYFYGPFELADRLRREGLTGNWLFNQALCFGIVRKKCWHTYMQKIQMDAQNTPVVEGLQSGFTSCQAWSFWVPLNLGRGRAKEWAQIAIVGGYVGVIRWSDLVYDPRTDKVPLMHWDIILQGPITEMANILGRKADEFMQAIRNEQLSTRELSCDHWVCREAPLFRRLMCVAADETKFADIIRDYEKSDPLEASGDVLARYNYLDDMDMTFFDWNVLFTFPMRDVDWKEDIPFSAWSGSSLR